MDRKPLYCVSKYFPLRSIHFCMRLNQLSKHFCHSDWDISKTCNLNASIASSGVEKHWPLMLFLTSGFYCGWLNIVVKLANFRLSNEIYFLRCLKIELKNVLNDLRCDAPSIWNKFELRGINIYLHTKVCQFLSTIVVKISEFKRRYFSI